MVITGTLSALLALIIGLVSCFFGFRLFRVILVLAGFLGGFWLGVALIGNGQQTVAIIVGLVGGIIGAIIFYFLYFIGIALSGAVLGAFVVASVLSALNISVNGLGIIVIIVGAVLGAIVALAINKLMIIISTALSGAGGVIYGIGYFVPGVFLTVGYDNVAPTLLGGLAWLVLAVVGVLYQYRTNRDRLTADKR
ncbi:MAG: DUF4203 domain-containing protein [Anaerolineaceae bacterium]|nr:DUF4203 domain-containing protein [Anaerolineaceae bacterium]